MPPSKGRGWKHVGMTSFHSCFERPGYGSHDGNDVVTTLTLTSLQPQNHPAYFSRQSMQVLHPPQPARSTLNLHVSVRSDASISSPLTTLHHLSVNSQTVEGTLRNAVFLLFYIRFGFPVPVPVKRCRYRNRTVKRRGSRERYGRYGRYGCYGCYERHGRHERRGLREPGGNLVQYAGRKHGNRNGKRATRGDNIQRLKIHPFRGLCLVSCGLLYSI